MYYIPSFTIYQFNHRLLPYFDPTKHLGLIVDYFLTCWIVILVTTTSSGKLQQPTFWGSPEIIGIVSIKKQDVYVLTKRHKFAMTH